MMQQAQELQTKMKNAQEELAKEEFTGSAGGAEYIVSVTIDGKGRVKHCNISEKLMSDRETLEDLITAACNRAQEARDEGTNNIMRELGISPDLLNML